MLITMIDEGKSPSEIISLFGVSSFDLSSKATMQISNLLCFVSKISMDTDNLSKSMDDTKRAIKDPPCLINEMNSHSNNRFMLWGFHRSSSFILSRRFSLAYSSYFLMQTDLESSLHSCLLSAFHISCHSCYIYR